MRKLPRWYCPLELVSVAALQLVAPDLVMAGSSRRKLTHLIHLRKQLMKPVEFKLRGEELMLER